MKMTLLVEKMQTWLKEINNNATTRQPTSYRVISIDQEDGRNIATIQVIGKNVAFKATPEEILADDRMTAQFSPSDIRNLTYLGYDNIKQPQYKILAKQQDDHNETVFAVHKRGEKEILIKTASEISNDPELLHSVDQDDAHMIGYTAATEKNIMESRAKAEARKALEQRNDPA